MKIIPAIDLKDNKCVRLSQGLDNSSVIFNKEPEEQAIYFENIGCKKLHIVDLDSAFGRPYINLPSIKKIRNSVSIPIQLGGGIRSTEDALRYFDLGIENIIIGSMSTKDPKKVINLSKKYDQKIYVSLDILENKIMIKGWTKESELNIDEILNLYKDTNIIGYVVTDIKNDGMLRGLDTDFISNISKKIFSINNLNKKIIIAGGLTNYNDIEKLKDTKSQIIEGIISGKSYYTGNINLKKAQEILSS